MRGLARRAGVVAGSAVALLGPAVGVASAAGGGGSRNAPGCWQPGCLRRYLGTAIKVPGTAALNTHGAAAVRSVSCGSAGTCSAGGSNLDSSDRFYRPFVAGEVNGTWGTAEEVPGSGAAHDRAYPEDG